MFHDRTHAGRLLAEVLAGDTFRDPLVLALPRGGVPVADPIAERLNAELDVLLVRKLGVPGHHELAMGAVALGGEPVLQRETIEYLGILDDAIAVVLEKERRELERRALIFRGNRKPPRIADRSVIVVDDGLATGSTALAALSVLHSQSPRTLSFAVPVGASSSVTSLRDEPAIEKVYCLAQPEPFNSVGIWYTDFEAVRDDTVQEVLREARLRRDIRAARYERALGGAR
jgi:putative phosphoribosyl transferase